MATGQGKGKGEGVGHGSVNGKGNLAVEFAVTVTNLMSVFKN